MDQFTTTISDWLEFAFVQRLLTILGGIIIVIIITSAIKKGLNRTIRSTGNKYRARKAVNFFGYFLVVSVVLFVYSDKLGNVGVALGVAGAGIAFALQEVIMSLAGWIYIVVTGVVGVGQRVRIGDNKGDIIDIGVLSTTIMEMGDWIDGDLYNGSMINVANSFVFKESIHNYSAEYPFLWDEITVPIRTESNYQLARKVFLDVLWEVCGEYTQLSESRWDKLKNKFRVEEARVQPRVTLTFDENFITYTLRYIVDYQLRRATKDQIFTRLLDEINKHDDINIATAAMEITYIREEE